VRPLPESSQSQSVSTINSLSTSHQSQSTSVVRPLPTNYRPEVDKSLGSTTSVEKGKLPQTGANNNTFGATLMGGLATLLGLIGFKKRNRKDDEK
ncbi:LPXTG cell wall anchor domain-containing protein, partial [Lactobacillus kitasatonis]|uniref:LPXTG cell wall anchor domain-containing protein n=1 Tax=Lactobacillus kitasatonis TaxID=237446 RepID=UPI0026EBCF13